MQNVFTKDITILTSQCDASSRLGVKNTFDLCMDLASEHGQLLGVGFADMSRHDAFWLTVRTRVQFHRRPEILHKVWLETWPGTPGRVRCERYYRIWEGEELLAQGRTEWAIMDTGSGKLRSPGTVPYPVDMEHYPEILCPGPWQRLGDDLTAEERIASYTVRPSDIDLGQHVNNAIYLRILLDTFSLAQQQAMEVEEMEISYRSPCFEGEMLDIFRRETEEGFHFAIRRPDGSSAILAAMKLKK